MDLAMLQQQLAKQGKSPPVEQWDPPFCGDIPMRIHHDGKWWYQGSPIGRLAMVKLFASVLKREGDQYFLVTPVEKVGIAVDDAPFLVTEWQRQPDGTLVVVTNVEDAVTIGPEHPVALHQDKTQQALLPYVNIRRNLWARLHQNVYYQWAEQGQEVASEQGSQLMLSSGDYQFSLGHL